MRPYWTALFAAALASVCPVRSEGAPARYSIIAVAPAKTSIYIGRLTVTPGLFVRTAAGYEATLAVDLWPYGFHDDAKVSIVVGDEKLARLERGASIDFFGHVTRRNGQTRRISGRATPSGPGSGKLDVRVFLGSQVTVSFSTTYEVRQ